MSNSLLEIKDLQVHFPTNQGVVQAVDMVNLTLDSSEIIGVVGESGSGKSTAALAIMRLLPSTAHVSGEINFSGRNLLEVPEEQMQSIRGKRVSIVFQDPSTFLNPLMKVGSQIAEAVILHQGLRGREIRDKVIESLRSVGLPSPERVADSHPHQLSGGMKQRVMIAMALSCAPALLIADEPTTALDVTVQMQILNLIQELVKKRLGISLMLITHDLGIVAEVCDRAYVMYAGKVVEEGRVDDLFADPKHPYTSALLKSVLSITEARKLEAIEGEVPDLTKPPSGCRFHPRCPQAMDVCQLKVPRFYEFRNKQKAACWLYQDSVPNNEPLN